MAYAKRYVGGFVDLPSQTTAIDSTFLNAVEAALLKLFDTDPTVDGQVQSWIAASTKFGPALILNKNVDAAAGIVKSKLDFTGANGIVNADVAGAAAIARSKLDFGSGLVNADVSSAAAILSSKVSPVTSTGTAAFVGDASAGATMTIANNATGQPFSAARNFTGIFLLTDTNVTGHIGLFMVEGQNLNTGATIIGQVGSLYTGTKDNAATVNVYTDGSGIVTIQNKQGSSINFNVYAIRTRNV